MACPDFGLVDIVRDYLAADTLTRKLFARFRAGQLRFDEVQELVGDGEGSVLFRLKEHCHALFRPRDRSSSLTIPREALFDLAVGSLFHEAMKFRENLYQHTVYGPKVRALRSAAGADADEIFREFEKILAAAAIRLEEALQETEALFAHTRAQFRVLLVAHRANGLVARYLIENAPLVGEVFAEGLDRLLAEIHESAARGYALAARSYLASGYFAPARAALGEALARSGEEEELRRLAAYAEGMDAYLEGRYCDAITDLERWLSLGPAPQESALADLAHAALSRVSALVEGPDAEEVAAAAGALAARTQPYGIRARA
jgi:tetratricopeptide (TPR) repeat protein